MKKCLLLILFLSGFVAVHACTCSKKPGVRQAVKSADAVFVGEAISVRELTKRVRDSIYITYGRAYQFVKKTVYKGQLKSDTITIMTGIGSADCSFHFAIGKQYVVYAWWENQGPYGDGFRASICSRTCRANTKEIRALRRYSRWHKS